MIRKVIFAVFFVSVLAVAVSAADKDNAVVSPSYFEGVWAGNWTNLYSPSQKHNITLTIGKSGGGGGFDVEYSWEMLQLRNRLVPAGSVKTKGRQEGDQFFIKWKNKQGEEQKITLQKESENKVKARLDRGGTLAPNESPVLESYLDRK